MKNCEKKEGVAKRSTRAFLLVLLALFICSILNWGAVSNWGEIEIRRITVVADNGMEYSALVYVPKNATSETPAPGYLAIQGNTGNARNYEAWSIEFARRGMVVVSVDNLGGGNSEYHNAYGQDAVPEYFYNYMLGMDIVDPEQITVSGHSMGAQSAWYIAVNYQPAVTIMADGFTGKTEGSYNGNLLLINGLADRYGNAVKRAPSIFQMNGYTMEEVVPGEIYGSFEEGNVNMLEEIEDQIHEGVITNKDSIGAQIRFVQNALDLPNEIEEMDQVWMWKDAFGLLGMFLFAASLFLLAVFMIDTIPFFASVKQPLPRNLGLRKVGLGISVAAAILFPVLDVYTGAFGLVKLFGGETGGFGPFKVGVSNITFATILALNLFGAIMIAVWYFTDGRKAGAKAEDMGFTDGSGKITVVHILKSLLLAVMVISFGWIYLAIQENMLGTDFYCMFFGYKPIPAVKFVYYIPYFIGFVLCFLVTTISMNVERRLPDTGNEKKDMLIAMVFNGILACFSITLMVVIENRIQHAIGNDRSFFFQWGTDITRLWGMPVGMFTAGMGNTYLYRKTGNAWLSAFVVGILCALGCILYGQIRFV